MVRANSRSHDIWRILNGLNCLSVRHLTLDGKLSELPIGDVGLHVARMQPIGLHAFDDLLSIA